MIGLVEVATALLVGTWTGPLVVLLVVLASAAGAQVLRGVGLVLLTMVPFLASIVVINTFLFPGASDAIGRIGPLTPTWSGLSFALQISVRLLAFSLALSLVFLTTPVDDLLTELERRGLGRRGVFVLGAGLRTIPRMAERTREIADAQRARGLDTEGRPWRRVRGLLPLVAPLVFGALTEVEEHTLALEARAFSAPVRRTPLRTLPDRPGERLLRWGLTATLVAVLVGLAVAKVPVP